MPTILSAKAWITETSHPSLISLTSALSDLLSSSSASVRTASACRHCSSAGDDARLSKLLDGGAGGGERIARQIDAVEIAKILAAVLQMIVDLQRRRRARPKPPRSRCSRRGRRA